MGMNIAIDGPAGAGKSTIARAVAAKLGYIYVDTGAMYRAIALYMIRQGVDPHDESAVSEAVQNTDVKIRYENGEQQVILNDENVSGMIRAEGVGNMASATSVYPAVRSKLTELQRSLAASSDVVMDGRDIGTTVLPDAQLKIYLTASVSTRAKRRFSELQQKHVPCDMKQIEADIIDRDQRDMNREVSPLRQASDAILVDSSDMTIDEVVSRIMELAAQTVKS